MANSTKFRSAFFAVASCIAFLSLTSCFSSEDDGGESTSVTETYRITNINDNYITFVEENAWYECTEDGLEPHDYTYNMNYSIENNVLTTDIFDSEIRFNGNSNAIIGTWTRNKNKQESCRDHYSNYSGEYDGYWCDDNYDIVKAVVTQTDLTITRDFCSTDEIKDGEVNRGGWTMKVINCNSVEFLKENEKVQISIDGYGYGSTFKLTYKYKGKSCTLDEKPSLSKRQSACNKAISECTSSSDYNCVEDKYGDALYGDFEKCMSDNNFPDGLFGE